MDMNEIRQILGFKWEKILSTLFWRNVITFVQSSSSKKIKRRTTLPRLNDFDHFNISFEDVFSLFFQFKNISTIFIEFCNSLKVYTYPRNFCYFLTIAILFQQFSCKSRFCFYKTWISSSFYQYLTYFRMLFQ